MVLRLIRLAVRDCGGRRTRRRALTTMRRRGATPVSRLVPAAVSGLAIAVPACDANSDYRMLLDN